MILTTCALRLLQPKLQRNQIAEKPSQRFETSTVECPRGGDVRKYASAEECAAKNQKTTIRHFGFTEKVYRLPCMVRTLLLWKRHLECHRGN